MNKPSSFSTVPVFKLNALVSVRKKRLCFTGYFSLCSRRQEMPLMRCEDISRQMEYNS